MRMLPRDVTGVVLCGGEGRRMGGADKPLLRLGDEPLVAHVLERMRQQVACTLISANRSLDDYRRLGPPVITDDVAGLGPLGGLASVAPHVTTPWLFCCPGDAPLLDDALIARLADTLGETDHAAYPHDGLRAQYLFLLLRTASCHTLSGYLAHGGRSVHGWLATIGARAVPMPQIAASFANVNSADALEKLKTDD